MGILWMKAKAEEEIVGITPVIRTAIAISTG